MRAVRSCTCGCPTIDLALSEGVPLGDVNAHSPLCDLMGRTAKGELVGVILFQNAGKLSGLEGYSLNGEIQGDSHEFAFPTIESLKEFGASEPPAPNVL